MEGGGPSKFFMGMGDTRNGFSSMVTVASYNPDPLSIDHNLNLLSSNNYHRVFSAHPLPPQDQAAGSCYITENSSFSSLMRAKIMSHPHYHRLLSSYLNCQKVGAPLEVVARLEEAAVDSSRSGTSTSCSIGEDPSLDQFMEAYCEMLIKYEQELTKPFKEAMCFLAMVESQIKALTLDSSNHYSAGQTRSADEVVANENYIDPLVEGRELKGQLLRKYGGYLSTLKLEFLKKKKKGKLPKEARQQLLDWWSRHTRWPYPSESQKLALGESTGLEQKQINNWFINQRKRHWKPSDDVQFLGDDVAHPNYCMDDIMSNPYLMDCTPTHFR